MKDSTINWFPGHMIKAIRTLENKIKLIDVILEILDARIPYSSRNPIISNIAKNKKVIIILNKIDLANDSITQEWKKYYENNNIKVLLLDSKKQKIKSKIINEIKYVMNKKLQKLKQKGLVNYKIKVAILGIPNVGKSTIINNISSKKVTIVGNKPGVTKGEKWIKIDNNIDLLDTPGILWQKFSEKKIGINLALSGSIINKVLNKNEIVMNGFFYVYKNYFEFLNKKYFNNKMIKKNNLVEDEINFEKFLDEISNNIKIEKNKLIELLFNDFINNKIGKISWEKPNEE